MLLSITGLGALAVNSFCAYRLARFRAHRGSLTRAAFLSARNDALANVAIIVAGLITAIILSPWPDLVVGLGIFLINLDAAREVFQPHGRNITLQPEWPNDAMQRTADRPHAEL
jgi:Co/Zn/Cd efflux system component